MAEENTTDHTITTMGITTPTGELLLSCGGKHFHLSILPDGADAIEDMRILCLSAMELRTLQEMIKVALKANVALTEERARALLVDQVKERLTGTPEDGNPFVFGPDLGAFLGRPPRRRPEDDAPQGTYL